jgi:hypothetical protein
MIVTAYQITGGVGPCVEVGAATERLAEVTAGTFGHVVDEDEGELVTAVDVSQVSQQARDIAGAVLIQAVQTHQRVQEQQLGFECLQGLLQSAAVALEVQAEAGGGDDVEIEAAQGESSVPAQLIDAVADVGERVLGEVDKHRTGSVDLEAAEAGGPGGDGDRQIEPHHGFAHLRRPSDNTDGTG